MSYEICPKCKGALESDGTCSCGYGVQKRGGDKAKTVNPECPWNDHGIRCNKIGSLSDSTNGSGPWYCATHYWLLKGWPPKKSDKRPLDYREQWYAERELPHEAPNLDGTGHFRCVADDAKKLSARLKAGDIGPRQREPGDDDDLPTQA